MLGNTRSVRRIRALPRRQQVALVSAVLVAATTAWLVLPAVAAPGNDSLGARIAERVRDQGLGFLVTAAEWVQYKISPPREGGGLDASAERSLAADLPSPGAASPTAPTGPTGPASASRPTPAGVGLQPALPPIVSPAVPGEGVYTARVTIAGQPAVQTALLRPDAVHTSYLAGVAWMSGRLLRFVQHPGVTDPGRTVPWRQPSSVPPDARSGLAATFNSGFKIKDSRGAYYADGHTVGTFRDGAASLVVYADGHVDVGAWGSDVRMTPQVVSVRQNLDLLLADARPTAEVSGDAQTTWGTTIGQRAYVWRSGIGVTATGDVVYAAGDALSAGTLATLLQRAGAVRAMELDINRTWVSYMWYSSTGGAAGGATGVSAVPHKLVDFVRPADRYFSVNNRDFFAVYAR